MDYRAASRLRLVVYLPLGKILRFVGVGLTALLRTRNEHLDLQHRAAQGGRGS